MDRRNFFKVGGISVIASPMILPKATAAKELTGDNIREEKRLTPVKGQYDVIVCGAGAAGVMAAIQAGRSGAKTLLIEAKGCLGGVWTSGLMCWILDHANKKGIMRELEDRLLKMGGHSPIETGNSLAFDVEKMKLLLEMMCQEAGVEVSLHTRLVGAKKDGKNKLTHVITESKSFREAWEGNIFIDASGDGDLGALSGCGFDFGSEEDGSLQPMSLLAVISGVEFDQIMKFVRWSGDQGSISKKLLLEEMGRAGIRPSYEGPSIFPIDRNLFMIMTNHEYGYSGIDSRAVSKATTDARFELHKIINGLKSLGDPWTNLRLVATADQIGIREGRRVHGLYTITKEDLINGVRHKDAVCHATFGIDIHSVKKEHEIRGASYRGIKSKPYDIPLRALIAKDVNGLMMAGRCISGDFFAHASYRVTGNAVPMGEAAGKIAAKASITNRLPQEVNWSEVNLS